MTKEQVKQILDSCEPNYAEELIARIKGIKL